jgi:amino acid transporter
MSYIDLTATDLTEAERRTNTQDISMPEMGQFRASAAAANAVLGSVFYAFPAVAAVAGIFSPLALVIACLLLFPFRPIMLELGSAFRFNGHNYIYLLQVCGKTMGIVGAASTLLDAIATAVVSAATASAYLSAEFEHKLPINVAGLAIIFLLVVAIFTLVSFRESTTLSLTITVLHVCGLRICWLRNAKITAPRLL